MRKTSRYLEIVIYSTNFFVGIANFLWLNTFVKSDLWIANATIASLIGFSTWLLTLVALPLTLFGYGGDWYVVTSRLALLASIVSFFYSFVIVTFVFDNPIFGLSLLGLTGCTVVAYIANHGRHVPRRKRAGTN